MKNGEGSMKVVILCGGKGMRLREHTEHLPKPMCHIGDRPLVWHIMNLYAHYGLKEFILCLGYKSWKFKEYFLNYRTMSSDFTVALNEDHPEFHQAVPGEDWKITLAETGDETMTGGRLWQVRKYLENEEHFCVTYGDGVSNVNISQLVAFHKKHGTAGTITVVHPMSRYGQVQIAGNHAMGFQEKSFDEEDWVNGGFMVFDGKKVWEYLRNDPALVLENDPLPEMVRRRQLCAFKHDGFWMGMDTIHEYTMLNDLWKTGNAPWKTW